MKSRIVLLVLLSLFVNAAAEKGGLLGNLFAVEKDEAIQNDRETSILLL
jgi:hypothetical protein